MDDGRIRRASLRVELVVELPPATDDERAAIVEDLVGGVPSVGGERVLLLGPVAALVVPGAAARGHGARVAEPVVLAAGLDERAVGGDGGRGAPGVGEDGERAEHVGGDVVLGGPTRYRVWRVLGLPPRPGSASCGHPSSTAGMGKLRQQPDAVFCEYGVTEFFTGVWRVLRYGDDARRRLRADVRL